jgi:hypothetical protein
VKSERTAPCRRDAAPSDHEEALVRAIKDQFDAAELDDAQWQRYARDRTIADHPRQGHKPQPEPKGTE